MKYYEWEFGISRFVRKDVERESRNFNCFSGFTLWGISNKSFVRVYFKLFFRAVVLSVSELHVNFNKLKRKTVILCGT